MTAIYRFAIFTDIKLEKSRFFGYNKTSGRDLVPISTVAIEKFYVMATVRRIGGTSNPCFVKISSSGSMQKFVCYTTAIFEGPLGIGKFN